MNRNTLMIVIGGLVIVVAVIGYMLYQEQHKTGIAVKVDDKGISVQAN